MKIITTVVLFCFSSIAPALACLWDYDTVEMEREQFPSVLEILSGKFIRHSPAFYYWRINDRENALKYNPDSLALYDDLAVAHSKLGNQRAAINIIRRKDKIKPNLYKTYANMGTFFMLDNELDSAVFYIQKALEIDPNAHFGREKYQLYLAEYLIAKSKKGRLRLPLDKTVFDIPQDYYMDANPNNFYGFLLTKYNKNNQTTVKKLPQKTLEEAIKGVTGMLHFADSNSPVLLEVLGDLLLNVGDRAAARQLASRAYLKASATLNPSAQKIYLNRIELLLNTQLLDEKRKQYAHLTILKMQLRIELEEGQSYYKNIAADELLWIRSNKNVDKEFANKYYNAPKVAPISESLKEIKLLKDSIENKYPERTLIELMLAKDTLNDRAKSILDSLFSIPDTIIESEIKSTTPDSKSMPYLKYIVALVALLSIILVIKKSKTTKSQS